ncbi:MAG: TIGR00269 family protein [Halococcoides sp.]
MECDRCSGAAVLHQAYSGQHLCETHLRRSVADRVRSRIREDALLADADADDPAVWLIGLSGGKDSAVLGSILAETLGPDRRVELRGVAVHEGIEGYRDESLVAARELADQCDIDLVERSFAEVFDVRMDEVIEDDPESMAACAYCGVFRRAILADVAASAEADLLLTGHNLDDECETALMNVFEGDVDQMARHWDASLGPLPDRADSGPHVPRAKPLRDVPEKEVALYARVAELPAHITECPHAAESFRGEIQTLMLDLEERHPGTRHSIMAGYEDLARLAATDRSAGSAGRCERCGRPSGTDRCRACELQDALA